MNNTPSAQLEFNSERLTMEEIEQRYSGEWVLIAEPDVDEAQQVKRGRVVFHTRDRAALYRADASSGLADAAILYIGPWPQKLEFQL